MNWTLLASEGRAAAQFIVRLKGIGGAATNKQFPGFRGSEKLGNGHRGSHDALLASILFRENGQENLDAFLTPWQRKLTLS